MRLVTFQYKYIYPTHIQAGKKKSDLLYYFVLQKEKNQSRSLEGTFRCLLVFGLGTNTVGSLRFLLPTTTFSVFGRASGSGSSSSSRNRTRFSSSVSRSSCEERHYQIILITESKVTPKHNFLSKIIWIHVS